MGASAGSLYSPKTKCVILPPPTGPGGYRVRWPEGKEGLKSVENSAPEEMHALLRCLEPLPNRPPVHVLHHNQHVGDVIASNNAVNPGDANEF